ncbi:hypothetical protein PFISCL1PPCAC_4379, partial [Pristionchus fissidentatus]
NRVLLELNLSHKSFPALGTAVRTLTTSDSMLLQMRILRESRPASIAAKGTTRRMSEEVFLQIAIFREGLLADFALVSLPRLLFLLLLLSRD